MNEKTEWDVLNKYVERALADPAPNCFSCFNFVVSGDRVRCKLKKWGGRELADLRDLREYKRYGPRAEKCGKWEGE